MYLDYEEFYSADKIPITTLNAINNYVTHGIPPGRFVRAVLENRLVGAYHAADNRNLVAIPAIVSYLYNKVPSNCWGSPEAVRDWLEAIQTELRLSNPELRRSNHDNST